MVQIFAALVMGLLVGWKFPGVPRFAGLVKAGTQVGLFLLLFCVGVQLGQPEIVTGLRLIGARAVATCLGASCCSLVMVGALECCLIRRGTWPGGNKLHTYQGQDYTPIVLWGALGTGLVLSKAAPGASTSGLMATVTTWALCWLVFLAGVDIARSSAWRDVREMGGTVLLVPGAICVGSIVGGLIGGLVAGMRPGEAMAVGAGFGWYSFSGVLLTNVRGVELGAVAFIANLLRELMTFMLTACVRRKKIRLLSVALGGATTMDSTLPMIARFDGPEVAVIGFVSGVSLTLLAPLVIPALLKV